MIYYEKIYLSQQSTVPSEENKTKKKKVPDQGSKESRRTKFPIKDWEKAKKERKIPDQRSEENRKNMQKGLSTRQYLNNTELSPTNKERRETMT